MTRGDACLALVAALCAAGQLDAADALAATGTPDADDDAAAVWRATYAALETLPRDDATWPLRWATMAYRDLCGAASDAGRGRYAEELRRALERNARAG